MTSTISPLRRLFTPIHPLQPGLYHYQSPPNDPRNYRLHLRLEGDGSGVLIVNASTILHLNQTAAEYAYYLVQNQPASQVGQRMAARYHVSKEQARQDYEELSDRIRTLIEVPDLDPVTFLGFERQLPFTGQLTAPYRLDCALTYRLPEAAAPDSAPIERVARELSTEEWKSILDKAWQAGIPHIVFTGGEPTLRDDLPELVAHAEQLGQVSGLLSDGLRLADEVYLGKLLLAGLDHLMIILDPENEQSWQAVGNAMVEDLSLAVHLTLTIGNREPFIAYLERLAAMGVRQVSLSTVAAALTNDLHLARERLAALNIELVWNLPVPYTALHPVALETGSQQIEGAGRAWLYLEPDGDVRPSQGDKRLLGNFLVDSWEKIRRGAE
jgi:hypothetical protein